ncbi:MAG: hypothetical protein KDA42_06820 [Planctomycetales bacterium]|nr:hypothetical protein [Planctomycetales bacterium]
MRNQHLRFTLGFFFLGGLVALLGCEESTAPRQRSDSAGQRDSDSADDLLHSALGTLNDLPAAVDLQLRPLKVVLDSTKSRNGKTVFGVITDTPGEPRGVNNFLRVVSDNGRFRRLEIREGDRIRYYGIRDAHGKSQYIELIVQQVVDENSLYFFGGLNQPVLQPQRLEIWRYGDEKVQAIRDRVERYASRQRGSLVWEPAPDEAGLLQLIDYLNGWIHRSPPTETWSPDPLLKTLGETSQAIVRDDALAELAFGSVDARRMQEAIWLRDAGRWAAAGTYNDLAIGRRLFDWTVRNIRLQEDTWPGGKFNQLWHTLLYGEGTARQRAWAFTQLAKQQGLIAVVLSIERTDDNQAEPPEPDFWCVGLLADDKLFLFDTRLGLPIPGAVDDSVAALDEIVEDPSLLRQLDLPETPYPIANEDLKRVVAQIPATAFSLSRRAATLESQMTGRERVAISLTPSSLAEKLSAQPLQATRLWDYPIATLRARQEMSPERRAEESRQFLVFAVMPELWKARVLYFQGEFFEGPETLALLRKSRPPTQAIQAQGADSVGAHLMGLARGHATYWLGLIAVEQHKFDVASDFLERRTLAVEEAKSWHDGARYLMALACEADGKSKLAIEYLTGDNAAQLQGNMLLARRLEQRSLQTGDDKSEPKNDRE